MTSRRDPRESARFGALVAAAFLVSLAALLLELALTRLFGVVLFASFAHLALAVALMGIAVGGVAQHVSGLVSEDGLERRVAWLALAQAATSGLAVAAVLAFPLTDQPLEPPADYVASRMRVKWDLVDPVWFGALLPLLTLPFACAGTALAGMFQHRRERIGALYGADLVGGATGALLFVPLLTRLSAPDLVFVVAACCAAAAATLLWSVRDVQATAVAATAVLTLSAITVFAGTRGSLLHIRYPAGFSESFVVFEHWTPVARIAVHEAPDEVRILLDNSSSSEVVLTPERRERVARQLPRSLVFRLHDPPARVAVLAASAGPDVAVAQHFGFTGIEAIDVAPWIGDIVAARYPASEVNPFVVGETRRTFSDARSAVLHSAVPYDIIQATFANLHGANGLLADAWSPALLGTREAFSTYLDRLSPDGTISFARGSRTPYMAMAAVAALEARGVEEPWRHIVLLGRPTPVLLVKPRPFTGEERDRLAAVLAEAPGQELTVDPARAPDAAARDALWGRPPLTDDRPFADTPADIVAFWADATARWFGAGGSERVPPERVLYYVMVAEAVAIAVGGLLVILLPLWATRRRPLTGGAPVIGFAACIGYGYLAIEIALIHQLVLFLGHPVYAVTTVVGTLMVSSGLGSLAAQRVAPDDIDRVLRLSLALVLALGALQALALPLVLDRFALGWPVAARVWACVFLLAPLGGLMGMPFPLAMRRLRPEAGVLVPWAWAANGWMSVTASLGTVVVARLVGYRAALAVALGAYVLAWFVAPALGRAGRPVRQQTAASAIQ